MAGTAPETSTEAQWQVVLNDAGCYSVWPVELAIPAGWQPTGPAAAKQECLAWIAEHWVDARPAGVGRAAGPA